MLTLLAVAALAAPPPPVPGLTLAPEKECLEPPSLEEIEANRMVDGDVTMAAASGLTVREIKGAMRPFYRHLDVCGRRGEVVPGDEEILELTVACTGRVEMVFAMGAALDWPEAVTTCVVDALHYAEFPAHSLPDGSTFMLPIRFEHAGQPGDAKPADPAESLAVAWSKSEAEHAELQAGGPQRREQKVVEEAQLSESGPVDFGAVEDFSMAELAARAAALAGGKAASPDAEEAVAAEEPVIDKVEAAEPAVVAAAQEPEPPAVESVESVDGARLDDSSAVAPPAAASPAVAEAAEEEPNDAVADAALPAEAAPPVVAEAAEEESNDAVADAAPVAPPEPPAAPEPPAPAVADAAPAVADAAPVAPPEPPAAPEPPAPAVADAAPAVADAAPAVADAAPAVADAAPPAAAPAPSAIERPAPTAPATVGTCEEGDAAACYRLARQQAGDVHTRKSVARRTLVKGCNDEVSHPQACFLLGVYQESGVGGDKDRTDAARSFSRACRLGDAQSCHRRGVLLHAGVGVRRDDPAALTSFERACAFGLSEACVDAGTLLAQGTFVRRDIPRATEHFQTACADEEAVGCTELGVLREKADPTAARQAFESGVMLGSTESMRRLSRLLWLGLGGGKNKGRARSLCQDACAGGNAKACRGPAMQ